MECCLLSLYQSIIVPIISEWICNADVCALDTAVCSLKLRHKFLQTLALCSTSGNITNNFDEELCDWMMSRNIRPRNIRLSANLYASASTKLASLLSTVSHLDSLEVDAFVDPLPFIGTINSIGSVILQYSMENALLESILELVSVSSLDISLCTRVTNECISKLPSLCPYLTRLSVPYYATIVPIAETCQISDLKCNFDKLELVDRPFTLERCHCSVRAAIADDLSAVNIAGRHYHLKYLEIDQPISKEEAKYLYSIVQPLESIHISNSGSDRTPQMTLLVKVLAAKCTSLTSLHMSRVRFDEETMFALLAKSKQLRKVELCYCKVVTDMTLVALTAFCPLLEFLLLREATVSKEALIELFTGCRELKTLNTGTASISDSVLTHVANRVQSLRLCNGLGNNLLSRSLDRSLQTMQFYITTPLYVGVFQQLFGQNPDLLKLELYHQFDATDAVLESLVGLCPQLASVSITCSPLITNGGLMHLNRLPCLTSLVLTDCKATDAFVEALLSDRPHFSRLAIRDCFGFSGGLIEIVARHGVNLKHVAVTKCKDVNSNGVIALLTSCLKLNCLILQDCERVDYLVLNSLLGRKFRLVNLENCGIPKDLIETFVSSTGFSCSFQFCY